MLENTDRDVIYTEPGKVYHWVDDEGEPLCNIGDFGSGNSTPTVTKESDIERKVRCERCESKVTHRPQEDIADSIREMVGAEPRDSVTLNKLEYMLVEEKLKEVIGRIESGPPEHHAEIFDSSEGFE